MFEKKRIRIMIADDHVLIREGLKQLLLRAPDLELIAEAEELSVVASTLKKAMPIDVLLLDLSFPEGSALDILQDLRKDFPDKPRILILTVHSGLQYGPKCFSAGAHGFLQKDSPAEQLFQAIRHVHSGQIFADQICKKQYQFLRSRGKNMHRSLSSREKEVLVHLAKGRSTIQISEALGLSPNTVKTYRSRLLDKLGFRNEADLVRYALANDLFV